MICNLCQSSATPLRVDFAMPRPSTPRQLADSQASQELSALHVHLCDCDAVAVKVRRARHDELRGTTMVSIFRPFGKEGLEPVRCGYPECNTLNPPEAKICWMCKRPLVHESKGGGD